MKWVAFVEGLIAGDGIAIPVGAVWITIGLTLSLAFGPDGRT